MKVTVCELRNDWTESETDRNFLSDHIQTAGSDLVLLPEMPFYQWIVRTNRVDPGQWQSAVAAHDRWIKRLSQFSAPIIIGSRPVIRNDALTKVSSGKADPDTATPIANTICRTKKGSGKPPGTKDR